MLPNISFTSRSWTTSPQRCTGATITCMSYLSWTPSPFLLPSCLPLSHAPISSPLSTSIIFSFSILFFVITPACMLLTLAPLFSPFPLLSPFFLFPPASTLPLPPPPPSLSLSHPLSPHPTIHCYLYLLPSPVHRFWPVIDNKLRQIAFEKNVTIRLLASLWEHTYEDMIDYLRSLDVFKRNIEVVCCMFGVYPVSLSSICWRSQAFGLPCSRSCFQSRAMKSRKRYLSPESITINIWSQIK